MRRKIILSLLMVFLFSTLGGAFATLYIRNTNETFSRHINFHQSEDLRKHLIIPIPEGAVRPLNTARTPGLVNKRDLIAEEMSRSSSRRHEKCSTCHHTPEIARQ